MTAKLSSSTKLTNTFVMKGGELFFVVGTYPKGPRPSELEVTLPAIPSLDSSGDTRTYGWAWEDRYRVNDSFSQTTFIAVPVNLGRRGFSSNSHPYIQAFTPRSFDATAVTDAREYITNRVSQFTILKVEEKQIDDEKARIASAFSVLVEGVVAEAKDHDLLAADEQRSSRSIGYYAEERIKNSRTDVEALAAVIAHLSMDEAVYTLAARYILAKASPRTRSGFAEAAAQIRVTPGLAKADADALEHSAKFEILQILQKLGSAA